MECGICRIPFKLEYFGDDSELIQIFKKKISEQRRALNANNEIINIRVSQSNRSINQTNNTYSRYRPNDRDIQLRTLSQNTEKFFIVLFHPNKFICIATLIVNVLISGLGTLILGVKNLNLYDFFLSIMQFCFCYPFVSKAFEIKKKKMFDKFEVNSFLWIYLLCIAFIFYLSSIYVGIFHNFVFFNPRKIKNKEKGICIIILNFIIGGMGTALYGIIADGIGLCERIKIWIIGISQICGFSILILSISIFNFVKLGIFIVLFVVGLFAYCSSIYTSFKLYKNIASFI